jgi:hypothetical protein
MNHPNLHNLNRPQIIAVMAMLIRILTFWPALAGFGVTVSLLPLSMAMGKLLAGARRRGMAAADARVKLITEVITGAWLRV